MKNPKNLIESIRDSNLEASERLLMTISRLLNLIQRVFPKKYGSYILEFIQNTDDAKSRSMKIELHERELNICNDGNPFNKDDILSICNAGQSSKSIEDYIGYLGIGFKSVFLISDSPKIYSGKFSFKFDKNYCEDYKKKPWQILPIWIDENIKMESIYNTLFHIPLKIERLEKNLNKIKIELKELLDNRIILFLRSLETIKIKLLTESEKIERIISKSLTTKKNNYEIYKIQEKINDEMKEEKFWLLFRQIFNVREDVKQDEMTIEWERDGVEKREVIIAFGLIRKDNHYELNEEVGTTHIGVYSFLPMKDVESGLKFIIQADFLTNPGRTELARDCLWNNWLSESAYKTIIEKCIPQFLENKVWRYNFIDILYTVSGGHPLITDNLKEPLRTYINNEKLFIAEDESLICLEEAIKIDPDLREYLDKKELKEIFPNKKPIHHKANLSAIYINKPFSFTPSSGGTSADYENLLKIKASKRDIEFFKFFYHKEVLSYKENSKYNIRKHNIFLTEDFRLVNWQNAKINLDNIKIPKKLRDQFDIIHPDLIKDEEIKNYFINIIGINELTKNDIQRLLKGEEIPTIEKNWSRTTEKKRIQTINYLFSLNKEDILDDNDFNYLANFITLKSKNNSWEKPEKLLFPKEYGRQFIIENLSEIFLEIIENHEVSLKIMHSLEFIISDFILGKTEEEMNVWINFFEKLGVNNLLKENVNKAKISEDIGFLTTFAYEIKESRKPDDVSSERGLGYDVESRDQEGRVRYIESKGSVSPSPDLNITKTEYDALIKKRNFYVYFVYNVLSNPLLNILRGEDLQNITDFDVKFPFGKWNEIKKKTFRVLEDLK